MVAARGGLSMSETSPLRRPVDVTMDEIGDRLAAVNGVYADGQPDIERARRAQTAAISVLDGDRVGDRGALSFPSLKRRG